MAPKLRPLKYGLVYCEACKRERRAGSLVAFHTVKRPSGGTRQTVFCPDCHKKAA